MAGTPLLDLPFDGRKLRRARVRARLTQDALAQLCSDQGTPVSRFQVVRAESCRNRPLPDVLDAFAKALDVGVEDLLTRSEEVRQESA
ncbi:helix-turn-helix domain-containing protein [Sphaerisporangium sp. NPDC049002]|uniref:helix-turn-helix domain-containing protein n=1 Tax=Sphaerisporangium sp. NPDC049002 TaxID=3155392 RepID=UPI0034063B45